MLSYEDILYSEDLKNWIDLRDPDGRKTMRGWCHGAPGILLSRMSIMDILPDDKQIKKDILRAVSTLFHNEREKKICLVPWNDRKSFNYEKVSGEESG